MIPRSRRASATWPLLTDHARVLRWLAADPEIRCRDVAERSGICERHAQDVINQLIDHGYVTRVRRGRGNHYEVHPHTPLRLPAGGTSTVADLLEALGHPGPGCPPGRPTPQEEVP
jgi:hypothetical protein